MPYQGHIDTPQGNVIAGWAVDEHGAPCTLSVSVGGAEVATVTSDRARPDLAESGMSQGLGGFRIDLGAHLTPGQESEISVTFPGGAHLPGSPFTRAFTERDPKTITYRGWIDSPDAAVVTGWALTDDGLPCKVAIDINATERFRVLSDGPRPDLMASNLSQGLGGFKAKVGQRLREGTNRVSMTFPNGEHLPGSPFERVVGNPDAFKPEPLPAPKPRKEPAPKPAAEKPKQPAPAPQPAPAASKPEAEPQPAPAPKPKTEPAPAAPAPKAADPAPATPAAAPAERVARIAPARKKPALPSLAELDELSLDDLALAVAAGVIKVPPPETTPAPAEPAAAAPVEPAAPEPEPEPAAPPSKRGFLARLFGRG